MSVQKCLLKRTLCDSGVD